MKKILIFSLLLLMSFFSEAQTCHIYGPSTMNVGQTSYFAVSPNAQCSNCYDWDYSSGFSQVSSTDQHSYISLTATSPGIQQVSLTYFDEDGCHTCTKIITIPDPCGCTGALWGDVVCNCGHSPSHGALWLEMSSECRAQVTSITWSSNGAGLSFLGGATSGTTTGPPPAMGVGTLQNFEYSCDNHQYIHVTAIVHFADCPPVTLESEITHEFCNWETIGRVKLNAYPNPSSNEISIEFETEKPIDDLSIFIYNQTSGDLIKNYPLGALESTKFSKNINTSMLPNGKYNLILRDHGQIIGEKLIIIERQ